MPNCVASGEGEDNFSVFSVFFRWKMTESINNEHTCYLSGVSYHLNAFPSHFPMEDVRGRDLSHCIQHKVLQLEILWSRQNMIDICCFDVT